MKQDPFEANNIANNPEYKIQLEDMMSMLSQQMLENNDKANLNKSKWGVAAIPTWIEIVGQEEVKHYKNLAEEEREKRGFGNSQENIKETQGLHGNY